MARTAKKQVDIDVVEMATRPDPFHVAETDEKYTYFHAEDNPLRIRELEREGYEVVSGMTSGDEGTDSEIAIKNTADSLPMNVPGHILMRRPRDLTDKIKKVRRDRFEAIVKRDEEEALEDARRTLKKAGVSGRIRRMMEQMMEED